MHPATPRRRQRARMEGHVAKSADLTSAMAIVGGLASILLFGRKWWNASMLIMQNWLENSTWSNLSIDTIQEITNDALYLIALILVPSTIFLIGFPLIVHLLQTRFLLHLPSVLPNFSRLSLTRWMQHTWTREGFIRMAFGLGKLFILMGIAVWFFAKRGSDLVALARLPLQNLASSLGNLLLQLTVEFTVALVVLAAFDFFYQRRIYEDQLMMTTEEIREESKMR